MSGYKGMIIPPRIHDEYTNDDNLTAQQKYNRRHPERRRKTKNSSERKIWARLTPEEKVGRHLRARYKISVEDWLSMFEAQNHKCATCFKPIETAMATKSINKGVVDHNHITGKIRGLLCHDCNRAIGLVKEDTTTLTNMIEYLTHE